MTFLISILALALTSAGTVRAPNSPDSMVSAVGVDTIFRYVSIGRNVPVVLGLPLPPASRPHLDQVSPRVFSVRPGHFSGAAGIAIHFARNGCVAEIIFTYPATDEGFDAKVASYAETLGAPMRSGVPGLRRAGWQDTRTRFEIVEEDEAVLAVLTDLALLPKPTGTADARTE